eukprot:scpid100159/ scgid8396/ COMM domain-containing protein 5; Hypertension-related calcium-regulated gene protein
MSMVQVMSQTQSGGPRADRTPFYGMRIPEDLKKMIKPANNLDKAVFRQLLQIAVKHLEGGEVAEEEFLSISSGAVALETLRCVFAGILTALRLAVRAPSSLKSDGFKADLLELKLLPELCTDLAKAAFGSRQEAINESAVASRVRLPHLRSLRWRVDVSISTSALNRIMEPSILAEMTLSDGSVKTFEVPVSKFHELRYNVAYVLREMDNLEQRNILKIQD